MRCQFERVPYTWSIAASAFAFVALLAWAGVSGADTPSHTRAELEKQFVRVVRPFLQTYCVACHGKNKPQALLDLTAYPDMTAVVRDYAHWSLMLEKLDARQMPPPNAGPLPSGRQRDAVTAWIRAVRQFEAARNAGDPGPVSARRLSTLR